MLAMNLDFNHMILSDHPELITVVEKHLGQSKHPVTTDPKQLLDYLQSTLPNILVLDFQKHSPLEHSIITTIREYFPMANIPIIAITENDFDPTENWLFGQFSALNLVPLQDVDSSLLIFAEMIMDEYFVLDYRQKPHPYTLHQIAQIWRTQESCSLLFDNNRQLLFHQGALKTPQELKLLESLLLLPPALKLEFCSEDNGNWIGLGDLLFETSRHFCKSGFLRFRKWLQLNCTEFSEQIKDLPLPIHTRKLLFTTDAQNSLLKRIRSLSLRITQIEQDLEILYKLQLIHFELMTDVRGVLQNQKMDMEKALHIPPNRWDAFLKDALNQEWNKRSPAKFEDSAMFNPWIAFHWQPHKDLHAQINQTRERYQVFDEIADPLSQRKYQQLQEHLIFLEQTLKKWQHLYQVFDFPSDLHLENTFYVALHHYQAQNFDAAFEILDHDQQGILSQVLKGWVLFCKNPQENARESLILLSTYLESATSPWLHCWAAIIEMHLQNWSKAQQRLEQILQNFNSEQVRYLYWMAQRQSLPPRHSWIY